MRAANVRPPAPNSGLADRETGPEAVPSPVPANGVSASAHPRPHRFRAALTIAGAVVGISVLGGLATDTDSGWYRELDLPSWQPPGAVFGPVWTILYALLAASAYLAWRELAGSRRTPILGLYVLNGALNLAWTIIFFRAHRPAIAGIEILLLLATIVALIILMRPVSRQASWALVPYALWVTFAAALTWAIATSN
jgi:benzodiazapine receptor